MVGYVSLDASRSWILYWVTHSLVLLGVDFSARYDQIIGEISVIPSFNSFNKISIDTIAKFQNIGGGFGGGPGQISHGAPIFACVLTLLSIGTPRAYELIDRPKLYQFILSMKQPNGGFSIQADGYLSL